MEFTQCWSARKPLEVLNVRPFASKAACGPTIGNLCDSENYTSISVVRKNLEGMLTSKLGWMFASIDTR